MKLPAGWSETTLGEVHVDNAASITPAKHPDEIFELYSVPNHALGVPERAPGKTIGSAKQTVVPGTVLLCKINPRINRVWVVGAASSSRLIASTEWIPFFPVSGIDPRFLAYYLRQCSVRDFLALHACGVGGSLMRVKPSTLAGYRFLLAPPQEQGRITAEIEKQFTRLDSAVAAVKRVQANLKRYRRSVLKAACEGRLVPSEAELARKKGRSYESGEQLLARILKERRAKWEADQLAKMLASGKPPENGEWKKRYEGPVQPSVKEPPAAPGGWAWATVDQLAAHEPHSLTDGPFGSNLKTEHYQNSGPSVIRLQNIGDGVFEEAEAHISHERYARLMKHAVHAGDLVIAALGNAPRACIVPDWLGPAIVKADCIRFKPHPGGASARYLNLALNSESLRKGTAAIIHGVGRPRLNLSEIKALALPLPPLSEQRRISDAAEHMLGATASLLAKLDASFRRSSALRHAVLKRAFEGKLVAQDPNDDPASVLLERIRAERQPLAAKERPNNRPRKSAAARAYNQTRTGSKAR